MGAPVEVGRALVLDFGGPVLLTPFELATNTDPASPAYQLLHERGPFAPPEHPDAEWERLQAGDITERDYWHSRAEAWARAHEGEQPDGNIREMIAHLYDPPHPGLVRPEARRLIHDARAAGIPVGVLTNDLSAFHSREWIDSIEILGHVDVIVDGSVEGVLKPHPRLYDLMRQRLDVDYPQMVFVDDQMTNVRGAEALGIPTIAFHPRDPAGGFRRIRAVVGLEE